MIQLSRDLKDIAELMTPRDSGNMSQSWRNMTMSNVIIIEIDLTQAPYATIVERGRRDRPLKGKEVKNVGFVSQDIKAAFVDYINGRFNNFNPSSTTTKKGLAEIRKSTPARNEVFLRSLAR